MNAIAGWRGPERATHSLPDDICVVIPAYNEELLIGRCIQSVLDAGIAPEHVYVVDDRSTDGTAAVVERFRGVNLLQNGANLGKLGGLRHAVETFALTTRYRYLALLDADSHVARDYFTEVLAKFLRDDEIVLVCGAPHSERHNWLTAYRALEYGMTLRVYRTAQDRVGVITVAPGCASTYRTSILDRLDWDGGTLVEDMDVTVQIHRQRLGKVAYTPHAKAYTQDPRTLRQYVGQLTRWYSGTWQVMRLRRLPFGRQRIDAEFGLLTAEGLLYAILFLLTPALLWRYPGPVLSALAFDQALWFAFACLVALDRRRADIVLAFPTYLPIRIVNCLVLLRTFWLEVVRRRVRREWFSVPRYSSGQGAVPAVEVSNA